MSSGRKATARDADAGSYKYDDMVTLIGPDDQEFTTGHLATVNSLLVNGYRLKEKGLTMGAVAERLGPQQAPTTSESSTGQ